MTNNADAKESDCLGLAVADLAVDMPARASEAMIKPGRAVPADLVWGNASLSQVSGVQAPEKASEKASEQSAGTRKIWDAIASGPERAPLDEDLRLASRRRG